MAALVDILWVMNRKGFGSIKIGASQDPEFAGKTIEEAYKLEESRIHSSTRTVGTFGSEGVNGKLIIFKDQHDGRKPMRWIEEA